MLLNIYIVVPLVIILVVLFSYINNKAKRQQRIEEAAARAEANRLARAEKAKSTPPPMQVVKGPLMPKRIIKKTPDLSSRQQDIINKIIDDSTFDNIELWGNTEPGELTSPKGKNAK